MSNPYDSPETQVANAIVNFIRRRMNLDEQQCIVAAMPDVDPAWKMDPMIEVCPGAWTPYGQGDGSQDGGALLREQNFKIWIYYKSQLDQYSTSVMLLLEKEKGILEVTEQVRRLVQMNALPTNSNPIPSNGDFMLIEPMKWKGASEIEWESVELRILRRSITVRVAYGVEIPDNTELVLSDYQ